MKQLYFNNQEFSFFSLRHEDHFKTAINIFKANFFIGTGNKSFRFICGEENYSVAKDVEKRFTEYAQYDDYILILKDPSVVESDSFMMYYKNNNKAHIGKKFQVNKLRDFIDKPLYQNKLKIFITDNISNKDYINLHFCYVKKNQKLFIYDGLIYFKDGCNTHPHHIYLQIASENGIINLLIISFLFIYIIFQFIKIYKKT